MARTELVFIPTPVMGHLLSTVDFAKLIINRNTDISILILIFDPLADSSSVDAYVESQSSDSDPSRLMFLTLPPASNPLGSPSSSSLLDLINLHKPVVKRAIEERVKCGSLKPVGACALNAFLHFQSLADDSGVDVIEFNDSNTEFDIPGFQNQVPSNVIPVMLLDKELGFKISVNLTRRFRKCNGILLNTFMDLESYAVLKLLALHDEGELPVVYPVGPVLDLNRSNRGRFKSSKEEEDLILQWLDQQPDSSVVFLCFGSMGCFDAPQIQEIAYALDRVNHQFLWSLRRPPSEDKRLGTTTSESETFKDALPEGFLDRTANKGKIIGLGPQVAILSHGAICGFVSHCGWNSTLESIRFGVPMATWPLFAEQQPNAFQLVKELGIAVEIRMDYRRDWKTKKYKFLVISDEIGTGVNKLMSMDKERKE